MKIEEEICFIYDGSVQTFVAGLKIFEYPFSEHLE